MTTPKQSLVDCLKVASSSTLIILEHKAECCVYLKSEECFKLPSGAYKYSFAYMHNRHGKSEVIEICYKKCQTHAKHLGWEK